MGRSAEIAACRSAELDGCQPPLVASAPRTKEPTVPKYTKPLPTKEAVARFEGQTGNYICHFKNQDAYVGRQGIKGQRIRTHVRKNVDLVAVQFMRDTSHDPCVRAGREKRAFEKQKASGVVLRNRIKPSQPAGCTHSKPGRKRRAKDAVSELLATKPRRKARADVLSKAPKRKKAGSSALARLGLITAAVVGGIALVGRK